MSYSEKQLIQMSKQGDKEAFSMLVEMHQTKVYHIAYNMLQSSQDAYDAAQDTFIKAYRSLERFHEEASFYTWLYRIASNVCFDYLRRRKNNFMHIVTPQEHDGEVLQQDCADKSLGPEEMYLQNETASQVRAAIAKLKEQYRIVMIMRDIEGMPYEHIAQSLQLSTGTVKSRINRGRQLLKSILINDFPELL